MRVALITANIGGIDDVGRPPVDCDFFYYTEKNLPVPIPNLSNRMKARYIKIMPHFFLPDYDVYVWIDGSVQVVNPTFIDNVLKQLEDSDVVIAKHPDRSNVYEELGYMLKNIQNGSEYLSIRYGKEPLGAELEFYGNKGLPHNYPLYATWYFARRNTEKVDRAFDEWWLRTVEYSNFDQAMFSYAMWKHNIKVKNYDAVELARHPHVKLQ